jgi:hypothetical protein
MFARRIILVVLACTLTPSVRAGEALTWPAAQIRLTAAIQQAKLRNDPAAVAKVKEMGLRVKDLIAAGKHADAERTVVDAEGAAGLDPGGRSMNGIPIFHSTPEMAEQLTRLKSDLDAAFRTKDKAAVGKVVQQMRAVLGDQAGLPESITLGRRAEARRLSQREAVDLFIGALEENRVQFGLVASGKPLPDQMVRFYADIVTGCCEVRDLVKKHRPEKVEKLDSLVAGACYIMVALQQPAGHMPFPDPRAGAGKWNVAAAEDGGSQIDTAEAGIALLTAGRIYANPQWLAAGFKAADWAVAQPCVRNFNYTAFSLRLLAEAFRATKNRKYLDAAIEKWEIGLAPAQLESGRWIDAHNARTAYHLMILRGILDLAAVIPAQYDRPEVLEELKKSAALATRSLIDEFDRLGVTNVSYALPALIDLRALDPKSDPRLNAAVDQTAGVVVAVSTKDGKPKLSTPVSTLAALVKSGG